MHVWAVIKWWSLVLGTRRNGIGGGPRRSVLVLAFVHEMLSSPVIQCQKGKSLCRGYDCGAQTVMESVELLEDIYRFIRSVRTSYFTSSSVLQSRSKPGPSFPHKITSHKPYHLPKRFLPFGIAPSRRQWQQQKLLQSHLSLRSHQLHLPSALRLRLFRSPLRSTISRDW